MKRAVLISLLAASLSGCSTISSTWNSWFGSEKTKPAVLETLSGPATGQGQILQRPVVADLQDIRVLPQGDPPLA